MDRNSQQLKTTMDKVLPNDIEDIVSLSEIKFDTLGKFTFCRIVLPWGYEILGKSAVVNPDHFDQAIGEKVALADAKEQLWPLLGFLLGADAATYDRLIRSNS